MSGWLRLAALTAIFLLCQLAGSAQAVEVPRLFSASNLLPAQVKSALVAINSGVIDPTPVTIGSGGFGFTGSASLGRGRADVLTAAASTAVGAAVGETGGAAAAGNEVVNNYLKHTEATRLGNLKLQKTLGQCDSNCERDIADLEFLDTARDKKLADCHGVSSSACDTTRQEVRNAAADYIRKNNIADSNDLANTYATESADTQHLAKGTLDGKAAGAIQGAVDTLVQGAKALGHLIANVSGSAFGDTQSQQNLRAGAGAAYDFVKDPNNWAQLLGVMSPADREKLAQAYERGDGKAVGQLMGAQLASLPMGGGAGMLGSISKVDKAAEVAAGAGKVVKGVEAVEDAAKVGSKLPDSPVDIAHTIGADYNARTGKVTGGHSLLNDDVKVTQVVNPPDANGVYEATVQMKTPQGDWVNKVNFRGEIQKNTMFPQSWDVPKIQAEIDSAWARRTPDPYDSKKWIGTSDSGVKITGYETPRATAYPVYKGAKK